MNLMKTPFFHCWQCIHIKVNIDQAEVVKLQGVGNTGGAIMSGFVKGIYYDGSSRSVHLILLHRISAPVLGLVALNLD